MSNQLSFKFDCRPALSSDDFLIAPNNFEAVKLIDIWPNWPAPIICVFGPPGCGKTHLVEVFKVKAKAVLLEREWFQNEYAVVPNPQLIIEDLGHELSPSSEISFFHLYNQLVEINGHLLITAENPPSKWNIKLKDLKSRLNSIMIAEIGRPDDNLISAVLVKMFSDRQLRVTDQIISFAVTHMERSFSEARKLVHYADQIGLSENRRITVPLIKEVINKINNEKEEMSR